MAGALDRRYEHGGWGLTIALVVFGALGGGVGVGSTLLDSRGLLLVAVAFTLVGMGLTTMVLARQLRPLLAGL